MDLRLTDDQQAIRETFAAVFGKESSATRVSELGEAGFDPALWRVLSSAGALDLALDGAGGGLCSMALVALELGRRLGGVPFVEAAVVARTLAAVAVEPALLDRVLSGELVATLALRPATGGRAPLVLAGSVAELVLALDGDELVAVEGPPGERVADLGLLALADRELTGPDVVRHVLATGADAARAHRLAERQWRLGTAAALVGLGHEAVRIGVEYARERHQFGVPIGTFQAVQHGFADVGLRVEGSELIALKAAWAADRGTADWRLLASMAFAHAAEAAQAAATTALHYHGGYGVALEYDIHRYVRRAKGWTLAAGDLEEAWQTIGREHVALAERR